jgi:hypothetical protein
LLELYLSCLCLEHFDPSLQCLIEIVLASCHLKNYFVITYLLEDEQELSLGMLIRRKRIYNFLCSMLVLHQFLYVLLMLRCTFIHFVAPTYYQDATVLLPYFLLFCISEKLYIKYSRNWTKQNPKSMFFCNEDRVQRGVEEVAQGTQTSPTRSLALARA